MTPPRWPLHLCLCALGLACQGGASSKDAVTDITISGSSSSQRIGSGLSIGDINQDGLGELLVGALGDSLSASGGGAAYLFLSTAPGTYSSADADVSFGGSATGGKAGSSVRLQDLNGDGDDDVILGAPYDSTGAGSGGGIFVHLAER